MTVPPEAVTAAAVAIHDADCPDRHCSGAALGYAYKLANAALEAAYPHLLAAHIKDANRERDLIHADLGELLEACGLGNYARPESPHEVMQQAIAKVRGLRAEVLAEIRQLAITDVERSVKAGFDATALIRFAADLIDGPQ